MQFTIKNEQTEIQEMGWICNKVNSFAYVASQYLYLQIEIIKWSFLEALYKN